MRTLKEKQAALAAASAAFAKASKGKTWGEAAKWFEGLSGVDTITVDGADKFSLKSVTVDGKKAIQVLLSVSEDGSGAEVLDVQAADAPMEGEAEGEAAPAPKAFTAAKAAMIVDGGNKIAAMGGGKTVEKSGRLSAAKSYNRAVSNGGLIRTAKGLQIPAFTDYDQAEAFGAWVRSNAARVSGKRWGYARYADDLDILAKTGVTTDNSNAGGLVPPEFINELIDNLDNYGVAPRVCDFRSVSTDAPYLNKHTADHTTYLQGAEGTAITASDATLSQIQLSLRTLVTKGVFSQQLWDDSAMGIGEWFAMSSTRSQAKAIDEEFFLGTKFSSGDGIDDYVGANNTNDSGQTTLGAVTIDDITDTLAKLQGEAITSGNLAIVCSPAVWQGVFSRFVLNAGASQGGPRRDDLGGGARGTDVRDFDGIPVYLANIMYEAVADGINLFFAGDFNAGTVAARRKDIEVSFSDQEQFSNYAVVGRSIQRCWWNHHGINNTANGSMVVKATL